FPRGSSTALARMPKRAGSPLVAKPRCRIDRRRTSVRTAMPDLEMQMCRKVGVGDANPANHLALRHALLLFDVRSIQRSVDRVVAAAVIDDHRQTVRSELPDADDLSVG